MTSRSRQAAYSSFIAGAPLGFWGIAIITGIVSSYIGDDELNKLNELLGI